MKKRGLPRKGKSTQFNIELDARGLVFFLFLAALTAATVFYLGIIFGKATRDPNDPSLRQSAVVDQSANDPDTETPNNLNIFNVRDDPNRMDSLRENSRRTMAKADRLLNASETAGTRVAQPSNARSARVAPTTTPKPKSPASQWPDEGKPRKKGEKLYSVQIFATKNMDTAKRMVKQLKRQAFNAYLSEYSGGKEKVYRVRVGKTSREEAGKLKKKLKNVTSGLGPPKIIQIN